MLGRSVVAALLLLLFGQSGPDERMFVAAGYAGPGAKPPRTALADAELVRRELSQIRRARYNAITTWIPWREAEPQRGILRIDGTITLIAEAAAQDLPVVVRVLTSAAPSWARKDPDASDRFIEAVRAKLSGVRGVVRVEPEAGSTVPIDLLSGPAGFARNRLAFWTAIARGEKAVSLTDPSGGAGPDLLAFSETAAVVTRNLALFGPLQPRARGVRQVSGGSGAAVEVRLLEARDVIMIVALNRAAAQQNVRIAFDPDIPEAIWQNIETGATMNFVMTKEGPALESTFAPHDVLVLVTSRKLR
jgi:hypothetical protein